MVSFRVSPEEYRTLCQACSAQGLRSVSELARAAVQIMVKGNHGSGTFDDQLQELRTQVQFLATELERLSRQVEPKGWTIAGPELNPRLVD